MDLTFYQGWRQQTGKQIMSDRDKCQEEKKNQENKHLLSFYLFADIL